VGGAAAKDERVNEPLVLSVEEAAELLGLSRGSAYQAVRCGDIPAVRVGRRWLVPRARLLELLGQPQEMREAGLPGPKPLAHENVNDNLTATE
jgi:excisionase family DNA binding protein